MKNKKIFFIATFLIIIFSIFLIKNNYKNSKTGNNMINKSADEIEKYILNIESYKANATITVNSNKNTNTYKVVQKYLKNDNMYSQTVLEPQNIAGVEFMYDGRDLKVKNSNLDLTKLYKNYSYIGSNDLSLNSFIDDYNSSDQSKHYEEDEKIIFETKVQNSNKYKAIKKLYVNKANAVPEKMEVQDVTQKTTVYILYNEIEINNLQKEDILAFKTVISKYDI